MAPPPDAMEAMEAMDDASARDAFMLLQRRFVDGLAARLSAIEQAESPQQRQLLLHRLAGAAGGYGFAELGALARTAELAVQAVQDAPEAAAPDALQALAREIARAAQAQMHAQMQTHAQPHAPAPDRADPNRPR